MMGESVSAWALQDEQVGTEEQQAPKNPPPPPPKAEKENQAWGLESRKKDGRRGQVGD